MEDMNERAYDLLSNFRHKHLKELEEERETKINEFFDSVPHLKKLRKLEDEFISKLTKLNDEFMSEYNTPLVSPIPTDLVGIRDDLGWLKESVDSIHMDINSKIDELELKISDVKSLLYLATTYEQAIDILSKCDIIDKKTYQLK